ncbi:hypothetical protein ABFX02_12G040400 [Erythranthe guttata]
MKQSILSALLLLALLIFQGKMEVKAQTCSGEVPLPGRGLCDIATCNRECQKKHGTSAQGRCVFVDTCNCKFPCNK